MLHGMRAVSAAVALTLAACTPQPSTLPLVPQPQVAPITVHELVLPPGERLAFDVRANTVPIGRAEWTVTDRDVQTVFASNQLVSSVAPIYHRLNTLLERSAARPSGANELLERDGETTAIASSFTDGTLAVDGQLRRIPGGHNAQTLHTAIGWLRAWADPDARPGFIFVEHLGQLYRLDVARPTFEDFHGTAALKVECRAGIYASNTEPADITVWLSADADHTPLRVTLAHGPFEVTADLAR
jgi:uncharacterized protein DUF3108